MEAKDRIIVAMDVDSPRHARELTDMLAPHVGCVKIGLELMAKVGGPDAVKMVYRAGGTVMYDGKFNDIPTTVGRATRAASDLQGVRMLTVHACCGREAMEEAVAKKGNALVLAVTVLTSMNDDECKHIFGNDVQAIVTQFALDAADAGVDGIVCSPKDLALLRSLRLEDKMFVTPGVRPSWAAVGDQKRVMTPGEAIKAGASMLVIGRPITNPPPEVGSPLEAVRLITEEIEAAMA